MGDSLLNDFSHYNIYGWMTNPSVGLKGVELKVFAIIHALSQGPGQLFTGSKEYLMEFTGASAHSVQNSIRSLLEKGYISCELSNYGYGYKAQSVLFTEYASNERRVKNKNYFQVQSWMVKGLGLKDLELNVYAIAYGLSQGDEQYCTASTKYIAQFCGVTDRAVRNAFVKLAEKGLVKRIAIGANRYIYKAIVPKGAEKSAKKAKNSALRPKSSAPNPKNSALRPKNSDIYKSNNKANKIVNNRAKSFFNFSQRDYDFNMLEQAMINRSDKSLC